MIKESNIDTHHPGCMSTDIDWEEWSYFYDGIYRQFGYCRECNFGFINTKKVNE